MLSTSHFLPENVVAGYIHSVITVHHLNSIQNAVNN